MTNRDLVPLLEWIGMETTNGGRIQKSIIKVNGTYAFQETVRFPPTFGFLVGDNDIRTYYLLAPEGITVDWWLAHGAEHAWIWENPYGEGYWCTVPGDLEKAIDLEFALRAMENQEQPEVPATTPEPAQSLAEDQWEDHTDEDGTEGVKDGGLF